MSIRTVEFQETQTLVTMECGECHILFAIPKDLDERALADSKVSWYCPNGHNRIYTKTRVQKLEEELRQKERELAQANSARDSFRASAERERRSRKLIEKRVANGVCPCCHRRVKQMADHIATKHPEYVKELSA